MTQPENDPATEVTFSRAQVRSMIAAEVKKARESFADYDDLKAKAAEADKSKTQLDKIETQLAAMTEQATKSARDVLIREVADELKISVKQAKRLTGKTREDLLADGREFLEEFKPNSKSTTDGDGEDNDGDDGNSTEDDKGSSDTGRQAEPPQRRGRPRENLRSGAPMTGRQPEETNPLKLAELIPRG